MVISGALVMKKAKPVELDQKLYLKSKNLTLNVLLILDNTPRHPQDLSHSSKYPTWESVQHHRLTPTAPHQGICHHTICCTLHESEETFVTYL